MALNDQLNEFVLAIQTMPRDELIAYISILVGLTLIVIAFILWLP